MFYRFGHEMAWTKLTYGNLPARTQNVVTCSAKHKISKWITDDSFITVVAVRSVLARHGANVREQTVPEVTVCLSL